ncbi:hypothetical protein L1887_53607 [Cichorium endivia]|nr:hypothetical protein L1887_53607 [Cichorium endivia]
MGGKATPRPCILADAHRSGSDATLCSGSKFVDSVGFGPKICGISTGAFTATASNSILLPGDAGRSAIPRRIPRWAKRGGRAAVNLNSAPPRAHSSTAHWTLPHHLLQTHLPPTQLVVCRPCPLPYGRTCRAAIASSLSRPPELSRPRKAECNPQGKRAPTRARLEAGAGGELTKSARALYRAYTRTDKFEFDSGAAMLRFFGR